jgi:hypothetical protein
MDEAQGGCAKHKVTKAQLSSFLLKIAQIYNMSYDINQD